MAAFILTMIVNSNRTVQVTSSTSNMLRCCSIVVYSLSSTHTHPFNGPFSGTTQVSQYQKGKTSLDSSEARDSEWQWHQLCSMQVCTSLHADNHASTPPLRWWRQRCLCRVINYSSIDALSLHFAQGLSHCVMLSVADWFSDCRDSCQLSDKSAWLVRKWYLDRFQANLDWSAIAPYSLIYCFESEFLAIFNARFSASWMPFLSPSRQWRWNCKRNGAC